MLLINDTNKVTNMVKIQATKINTLRAVDGARQKNCLHVNRLFHFVVLQSINNERKLSAANDGLFLRLRGFCLRLQCCT